MAYGLWLMAYGLWLMAYGLCFQFSFFEIENFEFLQLFLGAHFFQLDPRFLTIFRSLTSIWQLSIGLCQSCDHESYQTVF